MNGMIARLERSRPIERLKRTENASARYALLRTRAAMHYVAAGHVVRRGRLRRYLKSAAEPRLQVGAGPLGLPGWLNSDLISGDIYLDLLRPLPLPDSTFSYVFGEHVIEHIPEAAAAALLRELHRVLRPGGVLRLTTPDLRKLIAIYEDENPVVDRATYTDWLSGLTGKSRHRAAQAFNDSLRLWGHQHIYDEEDLAARFYEAGFAEVRRAEPGESEHEALRGLERHGGAEWVNRAEAMCLEATRAP
jgi:predicted SAM-dependent methyltransferase